MTAKLYCVLLLSFAACDLTGAADGADFETVAGEGDFRSPMEGTWVGTLSGGGRAQITAWDETSQRFLRPGESAEQYYARKRAYGAGPRDIALSLALKSTTTVDLGLLCGGRQTAPVWSVNPKSVAVRVPAVSYRKKFVEKVYGYSANVDLSAQLSKDQKQLAVNLQVVLPRPCATVTESVTFTRPAKKPR